MYDIAEYFPEKLSSGWKKYSVCQELSTKCF